jgi:GT2 family glycosyltransferase
MTMRWGVVLVHWGGLADTLGCLETVAMLDPAPAAVAIGVNAHPDEPFDEKAVRAVCPDVIVAPSPTNDGYAGGSNRGTRALLAAHPDVDALWLLNNDTLVAPGALAQLAAAFEADARVGIAGPVVVYADEPERVWSAGASINRVLGYTRHIGFRSRAPQETGRRVDYITGAAIAVRRDVWERLGGFDEAYFHYFDDSDLCERARLAGYASYLAPGPPVLHRVSAATAEIGADRLNGSQSYYFARNRWRFLRRDMRGWRRVTSLCAQPLLTAYECLQAARARNWPEIGGRLSGLVAGVVGRTGRR